MDAINRALLAFEMGDYQNMPGMTVLAPPEGIREDLIAVLQAEYPDHPAADIAVDVDAALGLWQADHSGQYLYNNRAADMLNSLDAVRKSPDAIAELTRKVAAALRRNFLASFIDAKIQREGSEVR